jgi:glycosyltransferase involved in cell wall biosynthesis
MMRIAYLLEDTEMAGGIRVAVAHADVLTARGHDVTLVTKGGPLTWRRSRARWQHVASFEEAELTSFDFVVATFWRTVEPAFRIAGERTIHFCQGYEGSFTAYAALKPQIDAVYRLPIPKITVSPHLVDICREFHGDATYVGQIVDDDFYQPHAPRGGIPRVLLVGPMQADFKGIDVGYDAVRHARDRASFELVRVSQWIPADDEPSQLAAEFHVGLPTPDMAKLVASCDVFLGPSRHQEGFGLPAAEAMASGVPVILSAIPSFRSWGEEFALFVDEGDGAAMGNALVSLLADAALRERLARRGREVAEQFRAEVTGARLESYFTERLKGARTSRPQRSGVPPDRL